MKIKSFKRIGTLFLACLMCMCMCFGMCTTASAAESISAKAEEMSLTRGVPENLVKAHESKEFSFSNDFGGFSLLTIVTASEGTSGNVTWKLKSGSQTHYSGTLGINNMIERHIGLPAGNYTVEVYNNSNSPTTIFVFLE